MEVKAAIMPNEEGPGLRPLPSPLTKALYRTHLINRQFAGRRRPHKACTIVGLQGGGAAAAGFNLR